MAKGKPSKTAATPVAATPAKLLNGVKDGRVTKPAKTEKSKSKDVAKTVAAKKQVEKKIRQPSPSDSDDSDADSDSDVSDSSDDDIEVEKSAKPATRKVNGANGMKKANDSDDSDSSDDLSDNDTKAVPAKVNGKAPAAKPAVKANNSDSDDSSDSDDNIVEAGRFEPDSDASENDDDEAPASKKGNAQVNGSHKGAAAVS